MTDTPDRSPKRLTAARLAGVPELELAFSDFTSEYDISDGEGVKPASTGRPVRLLQESLLEMGYDLPSGADGIYGSETQRAAMQFQVDAGHPWPDGHEWEHIGGIAGANTMAHFDMFDPGGTVSSHVTAETGVPAAAARFDESPDHLFMGFDASTSPPSLVVGTTTRRRVKVVREPVESDVTFDVADPGIATVGTTHEGVVVGGESAGTTTVRATAGGQMLAELVVTVKDAREHVVNFFFDSGSERDHEKATLLALRLNRLWRRQANVRFTLGIVEDVDLPDVTGPVVAAVDAPAYAPLAVAGDLNVVCVRVWDGAGYDAAQVDPFLVFLPDLDCPDGMDLVRAAGVFLGGGAQPACGDEERRRITKALADRANPSGT